MPKHAAAIAGTAVTLALLCAAELGLRTAGIEPRSWPTRGDPAGFAGTVVDPLLGPLPRPGWSGRWMEEEFQAEIDARGFRATGLPPPAAPRARVAFLGDSCSFGWGVGTPETYVARLDALQREAGGASIELVNGAYPGDSAVLGLAKLRERILPLAPDLVVLAFSANNAFRLALQSDAERLRLYRARKLALRSRLVHVFAAWLANARGAGAHPRDRQAILALPPGELRRVADAADFESALRRSVAEARAAGAQVVFLPLPRALEVSERYPNEDAARSFRTAPLPPAAQAAPPGAREIALLEVSCLEAGREDALAVLRAEIGSWLPVHPIHAVAREKLRRAASAWLEGDGETARSELSEALRLAPDSPGLRYALGLVELASGDGAGLASLAEADRLACNVFLRYRVLAWRVAAELGVPVVDLALPFQAHEAEDLYLDSAHPSPLGHRLIAEALWPVLRGALLEPGPS